MILDSIYKLDSSFGGLMFSHFFILQILIEYLLCYYLISMPPYPKLYLNIPINPPFGGSSVSMTVTSYPSQKTCSSPLFL